MTWIRRRLVELAQFRDSARLSGAGVVAIAPRFLRLLFMERYSPAEVVVLGLLADSGPIAEQAFVSKERMLAKQLRVNPRECFDFTEDKLVFFRRCQDHGL